MAFISRSYAGAQAVTYSKLRSARLYSTTQEITTPRHAISSDPLHGTMPEHDYYLFLHTTRPPVSWPSHIEPVSPLLSELKREMKKHNGIANVAYYDPSLLAKHDPIHLGPSGAAWDESGPETYKATIYGVNRKPAIAQSVSLSNYGSLIKDYLALQANDSITVGEDRIRFYVCTHGSRDCRCGDVGGEVLAALRQAVSKSEPDIRSKVEIAEVGHVGGHVWAANVLVYPPGDWLGNVRPSDIPALLKQYTDPDGSDGSQSTLSRLHRRGRMGRTKLDELKLQEEQVSKEKLKPLSRAKASTQSWSIPFVTYDGSIIFVPASAGDSLMKVAKSAGVPSIEGVCDGKLECATCHLYIPPRPTDAALAPIPAISEAEEDMLDYAIGRRDESRLGCQIPVTKELVHWLEGGGQLKLPRF
ncbi:hypothetical protein FRB95_004277 [Tulasnella sp. JGI-2019a]|nr:hypothetical protein FRB93_010064 [Tulasnella sp. JGI-2019a]KAG9030139.1 hypothetical protein FRB95_004277 [Tulasnella sp. JGI-2019a]